MKKLFILAALALIPFFAKAQNLCPDDRHPHVIDLGLPSGTKWACCNVGASKPEDYGSYFAWGETRAKSNYDWSTYRWCNGSYTTMTKYNYDSSYGTVDDRTRLELSDDAARANWHGSWRMPTIAECRELKDNCSYEWTTVNGVKGGKFTSRSNGRSIFLPAAGFRGGTSLYNYRGMGEGNYWASTLGEVGPTLPVQSPVEAHFLHFCLDEVGTACDLSRCHGQSVRPVLKY